ncbi:MAG: DUF2892 domain-containing protein [Magnetospirillum sp.]|nr:DUF2892 domain-containing protein [Magnetospirillum sp.]
MPVAFFRASGLDSGGTWLSPAMFDGKADEGEAMGRGEKDLNRALETLQAEVPDPLCRAIRWLRDPKVRWVRIPVGVFFILGGFLWFLPVFGLEWLLIGVVLIAQDVPVLRRPVGRAMLALERKWEEFRRRHWPYRHRRGRRSCP